MSEIITIVFIAFGFGFIAVAIVSFFDNLKWNNPEEVDDCLDGIKHSYDDFGQCYKCGKLERDNYGD